MATILSAQCTDERVNMVTPALFSKYPTAHALATADPMTLEGDIRSTGFFRAKTRSILGMARGLVERHGGDVPRIRDALTALPGVGLKTANVVLGNAFGQSRRSPSTRTSSGSRSAWGSRSPRTPRRSTISWSTSCRGAGWTQGTHLVDHSRPADLRGAQARVPEAARCGPCAPGPARPGPEPAVS